MGNPGKSPGSVLVQLFLSSFLHLHDVNFNDITLFDIVSFADVPNCYPEPRLDPALAAVDFNHSNHPY